MTVVTELQNDPALAVLLTWCRERETLPLLNHEDLALWARQAPAEYTAALDEHRLLQRAIDVLDVEDWTLDVEDWTLGVEETTVLTTAPRATLAPVQESAGHGGPQATAATDRLEALRARRPSMRMFPWE